jgi:hypothetical protein
MFIHYYDINRIFFIELNNMKKSMEIIEKMTKKYMIRFHLLFGNDNIIAKNKIYKKLLKTKRNKQCIILNNYLNSNLNKLILNYEF